MPLPHTHHLNPAQPPPLALEVLREPNQRRTATPTRTTHRPATPTRNTHTHNQPPKPKQERHCESTPRQMAPCATPAAPEPGPDRLPGQHRGGRPRSEPAGAAYADPRPEPRHGRLRLAHGRPPLPLHPCHRVPRRRQDRTRPPAPIEPAAPAAYTAMLPGDLVEAHETFLEPAPPRAVPATPRPRPPPPPCTRRAGPWGDARPRRIAKGNFRIPGWQRPGERTDTGREERPKIGPSPLE